jgi:hypothetical protein
LPSVVGGILILPATPDIVASFIDAAVDAPEELSTIASVLPAPPMPFVPEEYHGKLVVMALMACTGETEAGQRAIAPFRSLAPPIAEIVRPMAYPEIYPPTSPDSTRLRRSARCSSTRSTGPGSRRCLSGSGHPPR